MPDVAAFVVRRDVVPLLPVLDNGARKLGECFAVHFRGCGFRCTHHLLPRISRVTSCAGGGTIVWTPLGMIWARIEAGTGRGAAGDAYPLGVVPLRITVRAAPVGATGRPEPGQRFREGTRRYPILSVTEKDACGRYLLCSAIEETPA